MWGCRTGLVSGVYSGSSDTGTGGLPFLSGSPGTFPRGPALLRFVGNLTNIVWGHFTGKLCMENLKIPRFLLGSF